MLGNVTPNDHLKQSNQQKFMISRQPREEIMQKIDWSKLRVNHLNPGLRGGKQFARGRQ